MFLSWKCLQSIPLITHWVLNACLSTAESGPKANKFVENSAGETEGKRESNLSVFTLPVTTTKMKSHGITFHRNKIYKRGNKKNLWRVSETLFDRFWLCLHWETRALQRPITSVRLCDWCLCWRREVFLHDPCLQCYLLICNLLLSRNCWRN